MNELDFQINKLIDERLKVQEKREEIAKWSGLLAFQGKQLEYLLIDAFKEIGIESVEHEPNGSHGHDLEISHKGMTFVIEVEGSKNGISIEKGRELLHWMADQPVENKGVLIGNPFREIAPGNRPPQNHQLFVKEVKDLATKHSLALVTTYEIFILISKKLKGESIDIQEVMQKLFSSNGEVSLN